jgi:hypothetical protein
VRAQGRIVESFARGSGLFQRRDTCIGHSAACAAALAVQQMIERDHLLVAVVRQGRSLDEGLQTAFGGHPPCRRPARPRPLLRHRTGRRPRQQGTGADPASKLQPASAARPWHAG